MRNRPKGTSMRSQNTTSPSQAQTPPVTEITFRRLREYGYKNILPIIPAHAPLHEKSRLAKLAGTSSDARGKTPGIERNGKWTGLGEWQTIVATDEQLDEWSSMGAGVGLRMGDGLISVDIDAADLGTANAIEADALDILGPSPMRVGRWPRRALFYSITEDVPYQWIAFAGADGDDEKIEIAAHGRQMVVAGVHPKTGKQYAWRRPLVALDKLTCITPQKLADFIASQEAKLPRAKHSKHEAAAERQNIDQAGLLGKPEMVERAAKALPNNRDLFPDRDDYIRVGVALKAALPYDERLAFDLWCDWAAKDEGGTPELWEKDWGGIKPPYGLGAGWLYEKADRFGSDGKFSVAEIWFDDLDDPDNPLATLPSRETTAAPIIRATPYDFPEPGRIQPRQWLYGQHYIRKFVSATVAPSGVGKSSLEIVEALAMTSGKPLLGVEPKGQFRVWLWNGEDPRDELDRRIAAAMLHYGLSSDDIGDRLFVDSGRDTEILLASDTREGAKISVPVAQAVLHQIQENRIDVLQIDPFVSSHRVSENDNGAIDAVTKQWAKIADVGNCSVELVHHVRKLNGQEITVEDSRGASALLATSRSARAISRMTRKEGLKLGLEAAHKRLFRFGDGKNNLALPADDKTRWFELVNRSLGNGPGDAANAFLNGDQVGVVTSRIVSSEAAEVDCDKQAAALDIIRAGEWRRDVRAGEAWVGVAIAQAMGLDVQDAEDKGRISAIVSGWIKSNVLVEFNAKDTGRKQRTFVRVAEGQDVLDNNIFG